MKKIAALIIIIFTITAMLSLGAFAEKEAALPFGDVPSGSWYHDAVEYCYEKGYMSGMSDDEFMPDTNNNAVKFDKEMARWKDICPNLYVLDFINGNAYEHMVFPIIHQIYDNFKKYNEYGVSGYYMFGVTFDYADFPALKAYLFSRLMWNSAMTADEYYAEVNRFLKAYYGSGWTYIREYIDRIEELSSKNEWHVWTNELWSSIIKPEDYAENIEYLTGLFDKAISLADSDTQKTNCMKASVQIRYIDLRLMYKRYEDAKNSGDMVSEEKYLDEYSHSNVEYRSYLEGIGYGVPENWTPDIDPEVWFYESVH